MVRRSDRLGRVSVVTSQQASHPIPSRPIRPRPLCLRPPVSQTVGEMAAPNACVVSVVRRTRCSRGSEWQEIVLDHMAPWCSRAQRSRNRTNRRRPSQQPPRRPPAPAAAPSPIELPPRPPSHSPPRHSPILHLAWSCACVVLSAFMRYILHASRASSNLEYSVARSSSPAHESVFLKKPLARPRLSSRSPHHLVSHDNHPLSSAIAHQLAASLHLVQPSLVESATALSSSTAARRRLHLRQRACSLAPSNMTHGSILDAFNAVDSERHAIWQSHPDWSEEQRQSLYQQRKADIASSFGTATLAPDQDVDRRHPVGTFARFYLVPTDMPRRLDLWPRRRRRHPRSGRHRPPPPPHRSP